MPSTLLIKRHPDRQIGRRSLREEYRNQHSRSPSKAGRLSLPTKHSDLSGVGVRSDLIQTCQTIVALTSGRHKGTNHVVAFQWIQMRTYQIERDGIQVGTVILCSDLPNRDKNRTTEKKHAISC